MPGSGKSVTARFFENKNIPVLRFGDQTDIGLKELNKELSEENERWYREKLRRELGMAAYAIKIEPGILKTLHESNIVVLDGLYSWEEYLYLKKKFLYFTVLCIYASPKVRYERLRIRTIRPLTEDEARERDHAELEKLNKGGPIAIADYTVVNHGTLSDLYNNLELLFQQLINN